MSTALQGLRIVVTLCVAVGLVPRKAMHGSNHPLL